MGLLAGIGKDANRSKTKTRIIYMFELAVPRKLMATGSNDNGRADSKESKNTYVGMHGLKLNE